MNARVEPRHRAGCGLGLVSTIHVWISFMTPGKSAYSFGAMLLFCSLDLFDLDGSTRALKSTSGASGVRNSGLVRSAIDSHLSASIFWMNDSRSRPAQPLCEQWIAKPDDSAPSSACLIWLELTTNVPVLSLPPVK